MTACRLLTRDALRSQSERRLALAFISSTRACAPIFVIVSRCLDFIVVLSVEGRDGTMSDTPERPSGGDHQDDDGVLYRDPSEINAFEIPHALGSLALFGGNTWLYQQAHNIGIVDKWLMHQEQELLHQKMSDDRPPLDLMWFISAQSQMWIFAAYELLRTWRENAARAVRLHESGGLPLRIAALRRELPYRHHDRLRQARELEIVLQNPSIISQVNEDLRRISMLFAQLEHLRVAIAKHQVAGTAKNPGPAYAPGYARINLYTGSMQYELSNEHYICGELSRREIADGLRNLPTGEPPTNEDIKAYRDFLRGVEKPPSPVEWGQAAADRG